MSTIQIVGIAAAAVVVLLLIIALVVTRKSGAEAADDVAQSGGASFLDSSPSDTFAKLGRPEHVSPPPVETARSAPADPAVVMTATGVASSVDDGLGLDWDQPEPPSRWNAPPAVEPEPVVDESEATGELPVVVLQTAADTPDDEPSAAAAGELPAIAPAAAESGPPPLDLSGTEPFKAPGAAAEDGVGWVTDVAGGEGTPQAQGASEESDDLVPLSSIIVTTSTKMVDLRDADVRRMLTELVTFEIDQATQFRKNGQSLDAVLQLTEAEKICRALGKHDTAREIRDMMRELKD